jgi:hypothetical protein
LVPITETDTKGKTGFPFSDENTFPFKVKVWECKGLAHNRNQTKPQNPQKDTFRTMLRFFFKIYRSHSFANILPQALG